MKVNVSVGKEISFEFPIPDGKEYEFMKRILHYACRLNGREESIEKLLKNPDVFADTEETLAFFERTQQNDSATVPPVMEAEDSEEHGSSISYVGFLHIKCRHCGEIKSFFAHKPITGFFCKKCGQITELEDLKLAWVNCECGKRAKYRTNLDSGMFDVECPECGNLIAVEYDAKRHIYKPIRDNSKE